MTIRAPHLELKEMSLVPMMSRSAQKRSYLVDRILRNERRQSIAVGGPGSMAQTGATADEADCSIWFLRETDSGDAMDRRPESTRGGVSRIPRRLRLIVRSTSTPWGFFIIFSSHARPDLQLSKYLRKCALRLLFAPVKLLR